MSNYILAKKMILWGGGIVGSGVLLFKYTTPTDEQLIAKLSPELKANYLKNRELRRKEQEELIKIVKKTAASNDPIWKTGDLECPWEKNHAGKNMLVVKEEFNKQQAQEKARLQNEKEKLLFAELQRQKELDEKKKNSKIRWFW